MNLHQRQKLQAKLVKYLTKYQKRTFHQIHKAFPRTNGVGLRVNLSQLVADHKLIQAIINKNTTYGAL